MFVALSYDSNRTDFDEFWHGDSLDPGDGHRVFLAEPI